MTTTNLDIFRELGAVEARLKALERRQGAVEEKLDVVATGYEQIQGGRKMAMAMLAVIGAVGGTIGAFVTYLVGR